MLRSFKTEIEPTEEQKIQINKTVGVCRFVYNFYIAHNQSLYRNGEKFMTGRSFSVWLNNEFLPANPSYSWVKEVSSKSVKKSIEDANTAFANFFKGKAGFPNFKKKGRSDPKMYFVRNNPNDCLCERHRLKIPTLGWMRLKEKGYIPVSKDGYKIRSGTVSRHAGHYYVSVLIEVPDMPKEILNNEGIGIDFGIKDFAILSDGRVYPNINKSPRMRKLEKKLRREQRRLSRKLEHAKRHKPEKRANIAKQILIVQRLHQRMENIRTDYIDKMVSETVKVKPSYIAIEDLNVRGMVSNRHLAKAIASQKIYYARSRLTVKCHEYGIEVRIAGRFYPSSKLCHNCGHIKKDLRLSDRVYHCEACGFTEDRDFNASLNLRDIETYEVA